MVKISPKPQNPKTPKPQESFLFNYFVAETVELNTNKVFKDENGHLNIAASQEKATSEATDRFGLFCGHISTDSQ